MIKKAVVKKRAISNNKVEKVLVENFVSLQKVLVNLSIKVDNLTNQISELLNLFELSAKALSQKENEKQIQRPTTPYLPQRNLLPSKPEIKNKKNIDIEEYKKSLRR